MSSVSAPLLHSCSRLPEAAAIDGQAIRHLPLPRKLCLVALLAFGPMACASADDVNADTLDSSTAIDSAGFDSGSGRDADSADTGSTSSDSGSFDTSSDGDAMDATADTTPACTSGKVEQRGCGKCGKQSRICNEGVWLDWSACATETGVCVPGDTRSGTCGFCGTVSETCSASCVWSPGVCSGEGACSAGATETQYGGCLDATWVKTRTCSEACAWGAWSACH